MRRSAVRDCDEVMTRIRKISRSELRRVRDETEGLPALQDQDEMAIPSYLHPNPLIRWIVWRRQVLIAALGDFRPEMTVLDFGCGAGVLLPTLCASGASVHAIDHFPEIAQRLCARRGLDVRFHAGLESIQDSRLDVIIAAEVLEHIDTDLDDYLDLFARKLKPDGRLLVSVPVEGIVYKLGRRLAGFGDKGHYHHHAGHAIIDRIRKRGFRQSRLRGIPLNIMPSLYLVGEFTNGGR